MYYQPGYRNKYRFFYGPGPKSKTCLVAPIQVAV